MNLPGRGEKELILRFHSIQFVFGKENESKRMHFPGMAEEENRGMLKNLNSSFLQGCTLFGAQDWTWREGRSGEAAAPLPGIRVIIVHMFYFVKVFGQKISELMGWDGTIITFIIRFVDI